MSVSLEPDHDAVRDEWERVVAQMEAFHLTDPYRDGASESFMRRWAAELPELTEENLRWAVACARFAHSKARALKAGA